MFLTLLTLSLYLQITFPSIVALLISFLSSHQIPISTFLILMSQPLPPHSFPSIHCHLFLHCSFSLSFSSTLLFWAVSGEVKPFLSLLLLPLFHSLIFLLSVFLFLLIHFFYNHRVSKKYAVDLIFISSSVLPFLHPAIHLPFSNPLLLRLHLFSLLVSFLASVSMGPTWGGSICCQCLSFSYSSTLFFTLSAVPEVSDSRLPLSFSVPPVSIPPPNRPLPLPFPSTLRSRAPMGAGGRG